MRAVCVGLFFALLVPLSAFVPAGTAIAHASETSPSTADRVIEPAHSILFAGIDLGRSNFIGSGFKRVFAAPEGARRFVIMATSGAGTDNQRGRPHIAAFRERTAQSAFMVGYRWPIATGSLTLLGGFETDIRQKDTDRAARLRGGGRIQVDLWHQPGAHSLVTASLVAGTSRPSAWVRASLGRAVLEQVFLGPEATVHVEEGYVQWRLGAHLTGIRLWRLEGRISAGFRSDTDTVNGAYWAFNVHIRL